MSLCKAAFTSVHYCRDCTKRSCCCVGDIKDGGATQKKTELNQSLLCRFKRKTGLFLIDITRILDVYKDEIANPMYTFKVDELTGIHVMMEIASDLLDRQTPVYKHDTTIFVSQSGETADTLNALEYALENDALCFGITIFVSKSGVASTKAYTSQLVVMAMVALAIGADTISTKQRREGILENLLNLPGTFQTDYVVEVSKCRRLELDLCDINMGMADMGKLRHRKKLQVARNEKLKTAKVNGFCY
ncbi:hypothetical protein SSX86_016605 [Deinandra increscens subsp. villosa]|uniref:SIS domain-containing protein n=1 Tax=Deinandra increscens subsp. villosa TaxID=3103831 RepID=A0AAP0D3P6_9ASTR